MLGIKTTAASARKTPGRAMTSKSFIKWYSFWLLLRAGSKHDISRFLLYRYRHFIFITTKALPTRYRRGCISHTPRWRHHAQTINRYRHSAHGVIVAESHFRSLRSWRAAMTPSAKRLMIFIDENWHRLVSKLWRARSRGGEIRASKCLLTHEDYQLASRRVMTLNNFPDKMRKPQHSSKAAYRAGEADIAVR